MRGRGMVPVMMKGGLLRRLVAAIDEAIAERCTEDGVEEDLGDIEVEHDGMSVYVSARASVALECRRHRVLEEKGWWDFEVTAGPVALTIDQAYVWPSAREIEEGDALAPAEVNALEDAIARRLK